MNTSKSVKRIICILQTLIKNKSKIFVQAVTLICLQLSTIPSLYQLYFSQNCLLAFQTKKVKLNGIMAFLT